MTDKIDCPHQYCRKFQGHAWGRLFPMGRDVNRFRLTRFVHNSKKFHLKKIQHFLRVALWFRPEARGRNPSPPAVLFSIYIVEVEIVIVIGMKKDDSKRKRG